MEDLHPVALFVVVFIIALVSTHVVCVLPSLLLRLRFQKGATVREAKPGSGVGVDAASQSPHTAEVPRTPSNVQEREEISRRQPAIEGPDTAVSVGPGSDADPDSPSSFKGCGAGVQRDVESAEVPETRISLREFKAAVVGREGQDALLVSEVSEDDWHGGGASGSADFSVILPTTTAGSSSSEAALELNTSLSGVDPAPPSPPGYPIFAPPEPLELPAVISEPAQPQAIPRETSSRLRNRSAGKCPLGHPLVPKLARINGFWCELCRSQIGALTYRYQCRECNFNLCASCGHKEVCDLSQPDLGSRVDTATFQEVLNEVAPSQGNAHLQVGAQGRLCERVETSLFNSVLDEVSEPQEDEAVVLV